jgi:anthranilate/para-aminobenzoate synthase component I
MRALFPSGSVTGAPKVRTSQIIAELEDTPRGPYTGAIGYISPGEAAFSVAIRTIVLDRETGGVELGVGSGITVDSDPQREYRECLDKAAFVYDEVLDCYRCPMGQALAPGYLARRPPTLPISRSIYLPDMRHEDGSTG